MLCVTNMILHGIDTPSAIIHGNTLERPYKDYSEKDRVNIIVTNPPFGGMEEDGIENNFPSQYRTRETADLFLALILRLLKQKGRAAVVLPDGFLFGEGMKTRLKDRHGNDAGQNPDYGHTATMPGSRMLAEWYRMYTHRVYRMCNFFGASAAILIRSLKPSHYRQRWMAIR